MSNNATPDQFDRLAQLEKAVAELQALNRLAQAISSTLEVESILKIILQETMALTAAEQGSILSLMTQGERQMHTLFKSTPPGGQQLSRLSDLVSGWVIKNGAPIMVDEITDDDRFREAKVWLSSVNAVLAMPMVVHSQVTGIIILTKTTRFTPEDLELMNIVANQCAQFLENAKRYQQVCQENLQLRREIEKHYGYHEIIGRSAAMAKVFALLERIIPGEARILIEGESGTGKELVARTIHHNGPRKEKKFVAVNCGALPETLLESELFGHVKGAFTGATSDRKGLFEAANGGTLFLDEIASTTSAFQSKLLRAIQEGEIKPVGAAESRQVNVRIIAATSGNLQARVAAGEFREDLYYRLNVITVDLPPLRARTDDIRLLAGHFLNKFSEKAQPAKRVRGFTAPAMRLLENYHWPGNIRELENVIERAVTLALPDDELISPELLPQSVVGIEFLQGAAAIGQHRGKLKESLDRLERHLIWEALEKHAGNRTKAAKSLGITRPTLISKMKKYKL